MGKWIFNKHTRHINTLEEVLSSIAEKRTSTSDIAEKLIATGNYKSRSGNTNTTTISNKVKELQFYNLIYKSENTYLLSTLGNYYYNAIVNNDEVMKEDAFINACFNVQFPHMYNKSESNVYPFRMIFSLMNEKKLDYYIRNDEILALLYNYEFTNNDADIRKNEYLQLIDKIIEFRLLPHVEKIKILDDVDKIADRVHQLKVYVMPILKEMGAIDIMVQKQSESKKYYHPHGENTKKPTSRIYQKTLFSISNKKYDYINKLCDELPAFEPILEKKVELESKYTISIFNSVSNTFLDEYIEEKSSGVIKYIKELSEEIDIHSKNQQFDSPVEFEQKLCELFNMFNDVKAERISGPGKTDVECVYLDKVKFNVEAKSTSNKLMGINAGRLNNHMAISQSKYTLVIAPDFSPAATNYDITGTSIVAVQAYTLCDYIQNMALNDNYSFQKLNNLIENSLGTDLTLKLKSEIASEFGVVKEELLN